MNYLELDMHLSKEAQAMQKEVRKFSKEVMQPAGIALDKLSDPNDVIAENSVLWDVFRTFREIGLHTMLIPKELGGMDGDLDPKIEPLLSEDMGYADAGLTVSLGTAATPFFLAGMSPEPELQQLARDYCNDLDSNLIGCWAITEPAHGTDWIFGIDPQFDDPKCGPDVTAVLKGDEYIINGQKAAWVSNGSFATHAAVHVGLDPSKGMLGTGLAIVPLDLPGIRRGRALDKLGQRPLNQGELFFEEVQIPKKYMIISDEEMMMAAAKMILVTANGHMGMIFVGLAQAAYEEALAYAKQRIQGGVPIFEHKNIKLQLFNMFTKVEAARALARRMALYNGENIIGSGVHAVASKVFSTQTAFEVASDAISVFGGNGLTKEYTIEKLFRDARTAMIEDGENAALSIVAAEDL